MEYPSLQPGVWAQNIATHHTEIARCSDQGIRAGTTKIIKKKLFPQRHEFWMWQNSDFFGKTAGFSLRLLQIAVVTPSVFFDLVVVVVFLQFPFVCFLLCPCAWCLPRCLLFSLFSLGHSSLISSRPHLRVLWRGGERKNRREKAEGKREREKGEREREREKRDKTGTKQGRVTKKREKPYKIAKYREREREREKMKKKRREGEREGRKKKGKKRKNKDKKGKGLRREKTEREKIQPGERKQREGMRKNISACEVV